MAMVSRSLAKVLQDALANSMQDMQKVEPVIKALDCSANSQSNKDCYHLGNIILLTNAHAVQLNRISEVKNYSEKQVLFKNLAHFSHLVTLMHNFCARNVQYLRASCNENAYQKVR